MLWETSGALATAPMLLLVEQEEKDLFLTSASASGPSQSPPVSSGKWCALRRFQFFNCVIRSRLGIISFILAVSIVAFFVAEPSDRSVQGMICAFLLSLWAVRFMYVAAPYFMRSLILRNARAYDLVRHGVTLHSI